MVYRDPTSQYNERSCGILRTASNPPGYRMDCGGAHVPLFNTALHSSSDRPSGYDIFSLGVEVPNREPRNGRLGIDFLRSVVVRADKGEKLLVVVEVVVVVGPRSAGKRRRAVALLSV